MNITTNHPIPEVYQFNLLQIAASDIHAAVIGMHIRLVGSTASREHDRQRLAQVRALLRALSGGSTNRHDDARLQVISSVRFCFKRIRDERGTETRWQEYLRKVAAFHPEDITAEAHAKLAITGTVLP